MESLTPIFYFAFDQNQKCLCRIVLLFCSEDRNGPNSLQIWTRRDKAERHRSEVLLQITAERKTDVRQELLPPSHAGGEGGHDASMTAFGEIGQKYFKSPERKKQKPPASPSPDCSRFWGGQPIVARES